VEAERWSWEKATSVLRNVQYRRAIERHATVTSKKNVFVKIFEGAVYALVGLVASTIVGVGSTADNLLQAAIAKFKGIFANRSGVPVVSK
jgi:hypothetical protein